MKRLLFLFLAVSSCFFAFLSCFPAEIRKVHLIPTAQEGLVKVESEGATGWIYPPHMPQPTATVPLYGRYAQGGLAQLAYTPGPGMVLIGFVPTR